jgi:hypothetical protein
VGRAALDEDAIRLIEAHNRDLEFDWTSILKGQEAPPEQRPFPYERRVKPRPRAFPAPAPQPRHAEPPQPAPEAAEVTAAQARLGSEGLARLRARHAEVLARISEKISDPARRDELKSQAEGLDPDTWVTDAEVTAGLEAYETVFESVRGVVGRRRTRRQSRDSAGASRPAGELTASSSQAPEMDLDEGDGDP